MERLKLNKVLKEQAIGLNACYKGISNMDRVLTEGELIELWKHFIDFGIKNEFPSLEFIKENFDEDLLHEKGVYVDEKIAVSGKSGIMVLNGRCKGAVMCSGFEVLTIYVRHDCDVVVSVKGMSKVFVHCWGNAKCRIEQGDLGKCYMYMHENATETHSGEVIIRQN